MMILVIGEAHINMIRFFSEQTLERYRGTIASSSNDCQKVVVAFVSPFRVSKWLLSIPRLAHNTGCP